MEIMPLKNRKNRSTDTAPSPKTTINPSAMLLSRREVTVLGCRRITEYGSTKIKLSVSEGYITVEGRGLTVQTYQGDELTVRGWLTGIFFDDLTECRTTRDKKE